MKTKCAIVALLALVSCSTPAQMVDIQTAPNYDPEMVRRAAKNGALVTEVVGSPTEFTGARSVADAMEMPSYFHGILLAGEPPTGAGNQTTRLILVFNPSQRLTADRLCADAASVRPLRNKDFDMMAVLCVGAQPVAQGRLTAGSYSSMTVKDFRALSVKFLAQVLPPTRS